MTPKEEIAAELQVLSDEVLKEGQRGMVFELVGLEAKLARGRETLQAINEELNRRAQEGE